MKVRYTPRALADLKRIYAYIHARSPKGAANVRAAIRPSATSLTLVHRGQETDKPDVLRVPVVRYQYAIYFRIREDHVEIVHVRHTSREPPASGDM